MRSLSARWTMPAGIFLAFERGDGGPGLAVADLLAVMLQRVIVIGRRIGIDLQIAGNHHRQGAQRAETIGIGLGLRNDQRQVFKQRVGKPQGAFSSGRRCGPTGGH